MDIKRVSCGAVCMIALLIADAHAAPTEVCFQSKADYEKYLAIGDGSSTEPVQMQFEHSYSYSNRLKAWRESLPKRKSISATFKELDSGSSKTSLYDGGGSTTPSGVIEYKWEELPQDRAGSTGSESKFSHPRGLIGRLVLTVRDPVCEVSDSTSIAVYESVR